MNDKLLKPPAMARQLGISSRSLFTHTKQGTVPCIRLGKSVRYDPVAVLEALKTHNSKAVS